MSAIAAAPVGSSDLEVAALVAAARSGDEAAFTSLYRRFADRVYRFCLLRVRRPADAEDLTQQTFIRVIENLPRFEERGVPFGAWLFRIARNATIDFERSRRPMADVEEVAVSTSVSPFDAIGDRQALAWAIDHLPVAQREVLGYRYFADLTTAEVAVLMHRTEATVRSLQARAIVGLRRRLAEEHEAAATGSPAFVTSWVVRPA